MARPFRFRGELSALDVDLAMASSATLGRYVDRLASLPVGGRKLGRQRAQAVLRRLLVGALDRVGAEYTGRFDAQMDHIGRLREQLQSRYARVLELFKPGAPRVRSLPADLRPRSIAALFDQLDTALADLERQTSRQGLEDAMDHVDQTRDASDLLLDVEGRRADADTPPAREPDLDLDDPDALARKLDAADEDFAFRRGEHDRAALVRYHERMRLLPEDRRRRAQVERAAIDWAAASLPPETQVTLHRIPDYSEGNLAAIARFRTLDPNFSGKGYEVQIRLEDGTKFRPDGIRFVDAEGRRYQFLESKEPYTWTENAYYASPEGRRKLVEMLQRDARIADGLRASGCVGFQYRTGHPELDRVLAEAIAEMGKGNVPGADLLSAPGGLD